ncbi:MAG: beta-lactamase family protein [Bacteroidia bacterium]|nr:beta-lactamase family protein [Bacteroidia bacterium]
MKRFRTLSGMMLFLIVIIFITPSCVSQEKKAEKLIKACNIEKQTELKTDDIFRIASISKSFTTTALLTLVEKGALSLESDVSDLIGFKLRNPKYPDVPITIKMLLSHSSSLNDSQEYYSLDLVNPSVNPDFAKCYNDYMPGTKYEYCNLGFNTLGAIVEKISGTRFDNYVSQNVIYPLKLKASFNVDDFHGITFATLYTSDTTGNPSGGIKYTPSENAYLSRAYVIDSGKYIIGYSAPLFSPTGGMKISAPDLARYMIMHMNYGIDPETGVRIIKEETSRLMQTPVIETSGEGKYCMALNQIATLIPGETMTGHTGSAYGLLSAMYFEPDKKFGIVMITNGTSPRYGEYVEGFAPVQRDMVRMLYDAFIK